MYFSISDPCQTPGEPQGPPQLPALTTHPPVRMTTHPPVRMTTHPPVRMTTHPPVTNTSNSFNEGRYKHTDSSITLPM